ncbi:phosphatase PAP2 family protein [Salinimicrobium catena]|uniref:phosphatase PAP2 family protein n=1 Tax=Salinimicrobium catena TaxID=390640 RepID=UPI002FE49053
MRKGITQAINKIVEFMRTHGSRNHPYFPFYLLIFLAFIVFVLGLNVFVELSEEISGKALRRYDTQVTDYITSFRSPELNKFFQFITDMGDLYAYIIATTLAAIYFFFKLRNKWFLFQLLGVLIISALANIALKRAFNRARPTIEHLVVVKSLSYPSGHAMSAMAFYGFLTYLVFQIKMKRWLRAVLSTIFIFLILAIGISRIYLGVHFPSDVAGGFIAGLIWVAFCVVLFNIIALLRARKRDREGNVEVEENLED